MIYTAKLKKAIDVAIRAHSGQTRKGKPHVSYIIHPLSVGLILAKTGADENVIIAGVLHDTIEDTVVTKEDIEKEFGAEIAEIVNDVTEQDKSIPWSDRKRIATEHIAHMNHGSLLVKSADQLHNMADIIEDYKTYGEDMFKRFNASKKQQLDRYKKLIPAIENAWDENPLLPDLKNALIKIEQLWK